MADLINLTPHAITIVNENNSVLMSIPPSGKIARLKANTEKLVTLNNGVPLSHTVFGSPTDLPDELTSEFGDYDNDWSEQDDDYYSTPRTYYIVSQLIKTAFPKRQDLLVPAEVVRDDNGVIIGCRSLGI
jgi:hypothetical protein